MKRFVIFSAWLGLAVSLLGGISEPDTVLYGKVTARIGDAAYQLLEGELQWTVQSAVQGVPHHFTTQLEPLADGRFSYRLNIPHELLAYDLVVSDEALPLTAGLQPIDHLEITMDGFPTIILAPAEGGFSVQQATRAMTREVNLEVQFSPLDSDGDGLPDWLEDRAGLDKWDPADAHLFNLGDGATPDSEEAITTFAEWRSFHFPGLGGDLELFASQDSDQDGISNLEEYGFVFDPTASEEGRPVLQTGMVDGHLTVSFRQRQAAVDLSYVLEVSEDLQTWTPPEDVLELLPPVEAGMALFQETTPAFEQARRFTRLRLILSNAE